MTLAGRLKSLMEDRGLSQSELARRVNVSQPTIYRLVKGEAAGTTQLHKIARELKTTPAYLAGETDDPSPDALPETISSEERDWVELVRALGPVERKALLTIARTMAHSAATPAVNAPKLGFRGKGE